MSQILSNLAGRLECSLVVEWNKLHNCAELSNCTNFTLTKRSGYPSYLLRSCDVRSDSSPCWSRWQTRQSKNAQNWGPFAPQRSFPHPLDHFSVIWNLSVSPWKLQSLGPFQQSCIRSPTPDCGAWSRLQGGDDESMLCFWEPWVRHHVVEDIVQHRENRQWHKKLCKISNYMSALLFLEQNRYEIISLLLIAPSFNL